MPGRHWTRDEKQAYRANLTIGRIVDELWIIIGLAFFVVASVIEDRFTRRGFDILFFGGFLGLGAISYWLLPKVLQRTMPAELWKSLPRGRFDPPVDSSTPRTYRELFRRWFAPSRSGIEH